MTQPRDLKREAAIIENDIDSLMHRVEMLEAHPGYSRAVVSLQNARDSVKNARADLHYRRMKEKV